MLLGADGTTPWQAWVAFLGIVAIAAAAGAWPRMWASNTVRNMAAIGLVIATLLGCAVGALPARLAIPASGSLLLAFPALAAVAFAVALQQGLPELRLALRAVGLGSAFALLLMPLGAAALGIYAVLCVSGSLLCIAAMLSAAPMPLRRVWSPSESMPSSSALSSALALGAASSLCSGSEAALSLLIAWCVPRRLVGERIVLLGCVLVALAFGSVPLGVIELRPVFAGLGLCCLLAALGSAAGSSLPRLLVAAGLGLGLQVGIAQVADQASAWTAVAAVAAFALRAGSGLAVAVALLLALVSGLQATWQRPVLAAEHERQLTAAGECVVRFGERDQSLRLYRRGAWIDLAGPDHRHADLLACFARAVLADGARLVVLGSGTRRLVRTLELAPGIAVRLVDPAPIPREVEAALQQDGPVPAAQRVAAPRAPEWIGGRRQYLWAQPAGAAAMVVAAEPLLGEDPTRASVEEHQAMRHAAGDGLVVQTFLLDATPPWQLAAALAAAQSVHAVCHVWLVGNTGLIVGVAAEPAQDALAADLDALPLPLRWRLHAAGIGGGLDWRLADLGPLPTGAPPLHDDGLAGRKPAATASLAANLAVLKAAYGSSLKAESLAAARLDLMAHDPAVRGAAMRQIEPQVLRQPDSVLLRAELWHSRMSKVEADLATCDPSDAKSVAALAALVVRFAHIGCPSPALQAALALPDARGERVREPHRAAEFALALDPGFAAAAPPLLAPILAEAASFSPLLDLHKLPQGPALIARCEGEDALAVALRARFPSACAEALVAAWEKAPLPAAQLAVLRELADPFVLTAAAAVLQVRGARAEVLRAWPVDLPVPSGIAELAHGTTSDRSQLMEALAYHQDPRAIDLLAAGLLDAERSVRAAAGAALGRVAQGRIAYDPDWQQSARQDAAAKLRALHNRAP